MWSICLRNMSLLELLYLLLSILIAFIIVKTFWSFFFFSRFFLLVTLESVYCFFLLLNNGLKKLCIRYLSIFASNHSFLNLLCAWDEDEKNTFSQLYYYLASSCILSMGGTRGRLKWKRQVGIFFFFQFWLIDIL